MCGISALSQLFWVLHVRSEYAINISRGGKWQRIEYIAVRLAPNRIFFIIYFSRCFVVVLSCPHVGSQCHLELHYWTIWEVVHFRGFFSPKVGLFFAWGFSLLYTYIINIAGRISEAAMGGARGAQRSVLRVKEPKKMGARTARARTRVQNPLYKFVTVLLCSLG